MARRAKATTRRAVPQTVAPAAPTPEVPTWRIVTREQLAVLMGVHPDTVTDNVRRGMPIVTRGGHGKEGAYDAVACLDWQRSQLGRNAKDNAQTRVFDLTAQLKELELELQKGTLVPRDQVVKDGQAFAKGLTAMIRSLPRRLVQSGVIAPEQEDQAADVCRELLLEVSRWQTARDATGASKVA